MKQNKNQNQNQPVWSEGNIVSVDIDREMRKSFLDYSMSVIVSRALPDVRDGLKPVHRRILYTMGEKNLTHENAYRKSADTVGAVLGSYHPHGDSSVYDAMVRLAQDFSLRYPLVDGQGNFGSVDGDPAAAYRYTEARMSKIASQMLRDIDKETVKFVPNYDDREVEPEVLPSRIPNLLINGSTGIAVGMATNIPPHNLGEVVDAIEYLMENPNCEAFDLLQFVEGPDFPTGGIIMGRSGIRAAYATGRGKIVLRGRAEIEEDNNGRFRIVITELPYMVNKARLIENIADLVKDKRVEGISDLRDESDREGMRVVVELKRDSNPQIVLNLLYKLTQLQDSVGVIMLALKNGEPKVMNLKEMLTAYLDFQCEVIRKRTEFDLRKASDRAHVLEGLRRATDIIDDIIATIRACSGGSSEAKAAIIEKFDFDEMQAAAIVAFRLGQLAGLEILKIENELAELKKAIERYNEILNNHQKMLETIRTELTEIRDKFKDERRTEILSVSGEMDIEDLIPNQECVITLTHYGYVKRQLQDVYKTQRRGGRGITGLTRRDEDFVEELFLCETHDTLLFITTMGRVYRLKAYEIPEGSRTSRGTNIVNLLPISGDEKVSSVLKVSNFEESKYIVMVTRNGIIKRSELSLYSNIRKTGVFGITLDEGDVLAWVRLTDGDNDLIVATKKGMAIRFNENDARPLGRTARGVKAIELKQDDTVVGMSVVNEGGKLLTVTEDGKGRLTGVENYHTQFRGGKGVKNYECKNGRSVAGVKTVSSETDDAIIISQSGIIIRIHVEDIATQSRYGSGVRVMRVGEEDKVVTVARTERNDEEETENPEQLENAAQQNETAVEQPIGETAIEGEQPEQQDRPEYEIILNEDNE